MEVETCRGCSQATASALTPLQAAAHMPIYAVWNLGGFAHVPLEQAALAFLPPARAKGQARETVQLLLGLAVAVGLVTSALTAGLPTLLPQLFSNDPALFPHIRSVAPQVNALPSERAPAAQRVVHPHLPNLRPRATDAVVVFRLNT